MPPPSHVAHGFTHAAGYFRSGSARVARRPHGTVTFAPLWRRWGAVGPNTRAGRFFFFFLSFFFFIWYTVQGKLKPRRTARLNPRWRVARHPAPPPPHHPEPTNPTGWFVAGTVRSGRGNRFQPRQKVHPPWFVVSAPDGSGRIGSDRVGSGRCDARHAGRLRSAFATFRPLGRQVCPNREVAARTVLAQGRRRARGAHRAKKETGRRRRTQDARERHRAQRATAEKRDLGRLGDKTKPKPIRGPPLRSSDCTKSGSKGVGATPGLPGRSPIPVLFRPTGA